jgi:ADP-dependent phosphofructokinase/glucokinase
MQHLILTDPTIPNEAKARFVVSFGQTIAKLRVDAEIEQELDEIRRARAIELAEMQELEQELEREKKALAALRRELEARATRAA